MLILRVSFSSQFSRLFSFFSYQYTKSLGALPSPTFRWQTFGLSIYDILFPVPHLVKDYLFGGLRCHYPTFVWHPTSSSLSSSSQQKELHLWFFWGGGGKHWYIKIAEREDVFKRPIWVLCVVCHTDFSNQQLPMEKGNKSLLWCYFEEQNEGGMGGGLHFSLSTLKMRE